MSRCFPFPPPGYEKKARIEDIGLLTKEKLKEKKHKKDKKDKEKKEGKDRKDKEKSKEKHKEKKDRKEKHKDKKDKDKDKETNKKSDEKKAEAQPNSIKADKLGPKNLQSDDTGDSKHVQELARRIRNDEKTTGSQFVPKIRVPDQEKSKPPERTMGNNDRHPFEEKDRTKFKKEEERKISGHKNFGMARSSENLFVKDAFGVDKRVEGIAKPPEKREGGKQMEGKEKVRHTEGDVKNDKQKNNERDKRSMGSDKDRDKDKKKEEKAKEMSKLNKEPPKIVEGGPTSNERGKHFLEAPKIKMPDVVRTSSKSPAHEGTLGKRKEPEMNGFLHDNGNKPNVFQRPVSASHTVAENGKKLGPTQNHTPYGSELNGTANIPKIDNKEHRINGFVVPQHLNTSSSPSPSHKAVQGVGNGEAPPRPPHPDSKYLSQILSVPKMEELPNYDNEEWLYGSDHLRSKKPKMECPETKQVWDQALRIESVDISALPYVIRF